MGRDTTQKRESEQMETIEQHREKWASIAKENGWYQEPFYVQVWVNEEGEISDSVSFKGMTQDAIVQEVREECDECGEKHYAGEWCGWE